MKKPLTFTAMVLAAGLWLAAVLTATQAAPPRQNQAARIDYQRQVQPILEKHCLECHSQDKRKGGLSLATYADALDGGRNGPAIRPGNSAGSLIVHRVTGRVEPQMPKDEEPLSDAEQSRSIRSWIDQGARATPTSAAGAAAVGSAAGARHARRSRPRRGRAGTRRSIGSSRRISSTRKAAEPAAVDDALFARRVYLDVWGLLPSPEELQAFLADSGAGKRERARRHAARRRSRSTRSTGSRSGTTCCATRTA